MPALKAPRTLVSWASTTASTIEPPSITVSIVAMAVSSSLRPFCVEWPLFISGEKVFQHPCWISRCIHKRLNKSSFYFRWSPALIIFDNTYTHSSSLNRWDRLLWLCSLRSDSTPLLFHIHRIRYEGKGLGSLCTKEFSLSLAQKFPHSDKVIIIYLVRDSIAYIELHLESDFVSYSWSSSSSMLLD